MKLKIPKHLSHNIVLVVLAFFVLGIIGYSGVRVYKNKNNENAQAATNCLAYTSNLRILCFARQYTGFRYANLANKSTYIQKWGVSDIQGSLGQRPKDWDSLERYSSLHNFLECSGFVNVVFYRANRNTVLMQNTNSQMYVNLSYFTKYSNLSAGLQAGDLIVIQKDTTTQIGHVAIFSNYTTVDGVRKMVTYEAAASLTGYSGARVRDITLFDYALRYNRAWK